MHLIFHAPDIYGGVRVWTLSILYMADIILTDGASYSKLIVALCQGFAYEKYNEEEGQNRIYKMGRNNRIKKSATYFQKRKVLFVHYSTLKCIACPV